MSVEHYRTAYEELLQKYLDLLEVGILGLSLCPANFMSAFFHLF